MRSDLPTGLVTFLFSDIEGSTGLAQRLGSAFRGVIDAHNAIVRDEIADAAEVRTVGDAFFLAFADPAEAVAAAVRIQRRLEAHAWPEGAAVRVRIGILTGRGELGGDDYVGVDVHRAARLGDAGHGGQVRIAEATKALLPEGAFALRDLGVHRLKGLERPERIVQVDVPGLPVAFPPLRTGAARSDNLPASTTALVGREAEIGAIGELLERTRLVTLLGPGGVGAGEGARRTQGGGWSPAVLRIDDAPTRLRAALGDASAEASIAAGRALDLEAALAVAREIEGVRADP